MHFFHKLTKAQKITFLIIVTIVIIIIIYSFFTLISRFGKISTTIQYAPYNATVTINGRVIKNKSTQYLEPGEYHITVEAEHFASYTNTITISRDYHYMVGILQPNDDAGSIYQNNHAREFTETEGLVGIALNQEGSARKNQHPILNYLPINNSLYSIAYSYDSDKTTPIISIKADPLYIDDAVAKLKTLKNVDLTAYEIIFKTNNPFSFYDSETRASTPLDCAKQSFNIPQNYTISNGQDLSDNYYTLQFYIDDYDLAYQYSHYRALFHKESDGMWKTVSAPQPILTQKNTPNVDKSILDAVNSF